MNVLVYDGPGVSPTSLLYTVSTLKDLLRSNYAIQTVTPKTLATEPWARTCALFVIPGGRDLPYLSSLAPSMNTIAKYVAEGGRYLGICAGAYFACGRIEWELGSQIEVKGERPLKFFPGLSTGCVYPGFQYESENGARSVSILLPNNASQQGLYYNGGGAFIMEGNVKDVTPLAYYDDQDKPGMVAGVLCNVKKGKAALWHVHIEYPIGSTLVRDASTRVSAVLSAPDLIKAESDRVALLRETFLSLNLEVFEEPAKPPTRSLPQVLCASKDSLHIVEEIGQALRSHEDSNGIIDDANDQLKVHDPEVNGLFPKASLPVENAEIESPDEIRHLILYKASLPPKEATPHFSISAYFAALEGLQNTSPTPPLKCSVGKVLMYGESITSTQTLLEKQVIS